MSFQAVVPAPGLQIVELAVPADNSTDIGFGAGVGTPLCIRDKQIVGIQVNGLAGGGAAIQVVGSADKADFNAPGSAPAHWDPIAQDSAGSTTLTVGVTPGGWCSVLSAMANFIAVKTTAGAPTVTKLYVVLIDATRWSRA